MDLTLLHLSDLQFGRHHVSTSQVRPPLYSNDNYDHELEKLQTDLNILKDEDINPNFIIISGDITETSIPSEYNLADKFLGNLVDFLGLDRKHVIIVPGNHDINRNLCGAQRLTSLALENEFNPPYFRKFEIYSNFFNSFYSDIEWVDNDTKYNFAEDKLFVNYFFNNQNVAFIGLNSCIDESDQSPHYGNITVEQCKKAF